MVLLLSTVMLITIDESQSSVFAQNVTSTLLPPRLPAQDSTSTPTTSAQDSTSTPTTPAQESTSTPTTPDLEPNDDDSSDSQDTSTSSDSDDSQQDATSSEDDETEDDFEQTNPLLEQIRESVSGALSATGIAVP
jgi:hypothetical protein